METSTPRNFRRHDTKETPHARFLDDAGQPIVLTGAVVRYTLRELGGTVLKVNRATATITDQLVTPGEAFYQPVAADTDTSGMYEEEWEVEYAGGLKESFPKVGSQLVMIWDDLDNV